MLTNLLLSSLSFSQENDSLPVRVFMKVHNPTPHELTLIVEPLDKPGNTNKLQYFTLKAEDSTDFPVPIYLEEDQIPKRMVNFSIYESPKYYELRDHYYWECDRIENTENDYWCRHVIKEYIQIDSNLVFDSETFLEERRYGGKIYQQYEVQELAEYVGGVEQMLKDIQKGFKDADLQHELIIYCEFIVETDSTVSNVKVLKSNYPEKEEFTKKLITKMKFAPAWYLNEMVRSKMVIPIRISVDE